MKTDSRSGISLSPNLGSMVLEISAEGPEDQEFCEFLANLSDKLEESLASNANEHLLVLEQLGSPGQKVSRYAIDQAGPLEAIRLEFKLIYESKAHLDGAALTAALEFLLLEYVVPLASREMAVYYESEDFRSSPDAAFDSLQYASSGVEINADLDH